MDFGGGDEIRFERHGPGRRRHADAAEGAQRPHPRMVKALSAALTAWEDDASVDVVVVKAEGRAFSAGGDMLESTRPAGRQAAGRVLRRRIPAQRPDRALQETLCRADRRHRHGRRRRHLLPWLASGDDRECAVRHAGGRHRLLSRCRRQPPAARSRRQLRHVSRPDRQRGSVMATRCGRAWPRIRSRPPTCRRLLDEIAESGDARAPSCANSSGPRRRETDAGDLACDRAAFFAGLAARHRRQPRATRPTTTNSPPTRWRRCGAARRPACTSPSARSRAGSTLSMDDCMRMEFRILNRMLAGHDFYEGIRAAHHRQGLDAAMAAGDAGGRRRRRHRRLFRAAARTETSRCERRRRQTRATQADDWSN